MMSEEYAYEFLELKERFNKLGFDLVGMNSDLGLYFIKEKEQ
jgi:hypothetical protein